MTDVTMPVALDAATMTDTSAGVRCTTKVKYSTVTVRKTPRPSLSMNVDAPRTLRMGSARCQRARSRDSTRSVCRGRPMSPPAEPRHHDPADDEAPERGADAGDSDARRHHEEGDHGD